jgi:RraA family protein
MATPFQLDGPHIIKDFPRLAPELIQQASKYQSSILADVQGRRGTMHGSIAALDPKMKCCGPALTVEVRPGDNLMIHAAMKFAKKGDVIVVDGKGDQTCALVGSIMLNSAKITGVAGIVIYGAVRDKEDLLELGLPVWSVGTNPNGPTKGVPGRINHPISCGGVTVNPGDLISADADGVVVVERANVEKVLPLAEAKEADEQRTIAIIKEGNSLNPGWLDGALRAVGLLKEDETL